MTEISREHREELRLKITSSNEVPVRDVRIDADELRILLDYVDERDEAVALLWEIMNGEGLPFGRIEALLRRGEGKSCSGCLGGSVHHTCGREPRACDLVHRGPTPRTDIDSEPTEGEDDPDHSERDFEGTDVPNPNRIGVHDRWLVDIQSEFPECPTCGSDNPKIQLCPDSWHDITKPTADSYPRATTAPLRPPLGGCTDLMEGRVMDAHEIFKAHKPRKGDPVTYKGEVVGYIQRVRGNLCEVDYYGGPAQVFIWCFVPASGEPHLNSLHEWPTKGD